MGEENTYTLSTAFLVFSLFSNADADQYRRSIASGRQAASSATSTANNRRADDDDDSPGFRFLSNRCA